MAADEPVKVTHERQLFVDDFVVASSQNVTRQFHQPEKLALNPILRPEYPWEGTTLLLNGSVVRHPESGLLRMYYCTYEAPGKFVRQPRMSFVCMATSKDGLKWEKPFLHNAKINGSDDNNIVVPWSCCDLLQVTYDPHDRDPNRRWKLSVYEYNLEVFAYESAMHEKKEWRGPRPSHFGACLYWSRDGLHNWTAGPRDAIPGASDVTIAGWDPKRGKYVAYVKTGYQGKRARAIAESEDFVTWPKPRLILHADEQDPPDLQLYSMEGWPYESLWLGYLRTFHAETTYQVDTQLVYSRDGLKWNRTPHRPVFLPNGAEGAWDCGYHTMSNNPPLRMGDELWIYYGSTNNHKRKYPYVGGIGLAKLRVDGFASMDAGQEEGVLTTKPVVLAGKALCVNADAGEGSLTVEVQDVSGKPRQGYEGTSCRPLQRDSTRHVVTWKKHRSLAPLKGQPVTLVFRMKRARLYSFWVE